MAQFEPGKRPPPPPRKGGAKNPDGDPVTDNIRRVDQAAQKLMGRKILPRLPMPKRLKAWYESLPQEVRYRASVVWGFTQTGLVILFATLGVALILKAITNTTVFEPDNAKEVFAGVSDPEEVSYSVETVRVKKIDGSFLRIDSARGIQVDPERKKLLALIGGVGATSFRTAYDGKIWLVKYRNWPRARQVVGQGLTANQLTPVYASELEPLGGKILNDKANVNGQRGWLVNFRMTRAVLLRLLSAPMLVKLGLDDDDLAAINAGKFKTEFAEATVLRGDRRLYQVHTVIRVNGARMRILATYRAQNQGKMKNLNLKPRQQLQVN